MSSLALSIGIVLVATAFSGIFSGAETGFYQMSRLRLRLAVEKGQARALLLSRVLHDRAGLLTSLLIGNNITIQVATSTVTYAVVRHLQETQAAEWIATAITTPFLFVFAELLPKNLFLHRADHLMLLVSPVVYGLYQLARRCGAVWLLQVLSRGISHLTGTPFPSKSAENHFHRHEIRVLLKDTREEGFLSGLQTGIMNRTVAAAVTPVKDVMTRLSHVQKVPVDCNRERLLEKLRQSRFTRLLVTDAEGERILGRINIYDVLGHGTSFTNLREFIQPLTGIAGHTTVTDAIEIMQSEGRKVLLVTRSTRSGRVRPAGIVTMKDLAEELLGELSSW
jgi:CBS domain containing-hemolysin-like protein